VFGDNLRFKTAVAIARCLDQQIAEAALERLLALSVAGIAGGIHHGIMSGMPRVFWYSGLKGPSTKALVDCFSRPFSPISLRVFDSQPVSCQLSR
jgi:hypothetical protein